ncbi:putative Granaticin polyketide synthase ketoacyl reductase 1 [Georgfuchsia toluolica]|uniref:Granaticin polyketide synthase ketoacyl reductase 1 n=1 Tax=Georgfuchsia toluolica TaxID=424218 RepID=A0A916J3Q6_9PROT|nr:SDR family NAD(P)-dependent oxidoreductase [Georgfuchsia toluolica]CAG4883397.1 putative Granaticin polyketide synthase ketoacyl reductase 1 [Georgfuchsia toluolica]
MDIQLSGKRAVVTGGGSGIGAAIAKILAEAGAHVLIGDISEESGEGCAAEIRARGGEASFIHLNVADPVKVSAAFAAARASYGEIQILINNAGAAKSAPFVRTDLDMWQQMMAINLTGVYLCCRETLPAMLEAGYGRIVNTASTAGLVGYAYTSAYCASKHGVVGLTRSLALETARTGVTVNAVCPGYAETEMTKRTVENIVKKTGRSEEDARAEIAKHNPQGRLIMPQEVANAVLWLCLPGTESMTGQCIAVAGGEVMN